jgi:hypothetical protein
MVYWTIQWWQLYHHLFPEKARIVQCYYSPFGYSCGATRQATSHGQSHYCFFNRVGTYVQRGSKFCFVLVVLVVVVVVADTLIRILHYCPISPCFQHIIAYSLARQPCARLPGSLARACLAALRALARQPCARCCPDKSEQDQQNITPYCTMLL